MDVEAILTRRPQVVLVDELAHTNIPEASTASVMRTYKNSGRKIRRVVHANTSTIESNSRPSFAPLTGITGKRLRTASLTASETVIGGPLRRSPAKRMRKRRATSDSSEKVG